MSALRDALDEQARAEQQRAVRALLRRPLLTTGGEGGEHLATIRRHARTLQQEMFELAGWTLEIDRETARLRKLPATLDDASRPARGRPSDPPFSRRRYVLLCLALAALERSDRQTTLRRLAESLAEMVASDEALGAAGIDFTLEGREQRRDLVAVVRWLLDQRVLRKVEGDEDAFVTSAERDALYQVERTVLAQLMSAQRPPSMVASEEYEERLQAIAEEAWFDSDEARRRAHRHALMRRLLDDPVVYFDELTDEQRDYFVRSRVALARRLEALTGLVLELRLEGAALVDPLGDATDLGLPEEGTDGHVALLLAEHLADHARRAPGSPVPEAALVRQVAELAAQHRTHWRKDATEPGAEQALTERALELLAGLRLVRRTEDGVIPRPAIGRYALLPASEQPVLPEELLEEEA